MREIKVLTFLLIILSVGCARQDEASQILSNVGYASLATTTSRDSLP